MAKKYDRLYYFCRQILSFILVSCSVTRQSLRFSLRYLSTYSICFSLILAKSLSFTILLRPSSVALLKITLPPKCMLKRYRTYLLLNMKAFEIMKPRHGNLHHPRSEVFFFRVLICTCFSSH